MRKVTAILAGFAALALAAAAQAEAPVVRVESGELVGEATEHANIFRAVPYAAAPVGKLRWAAPEPAPAWQGRRDASQIGPSCPQKMNADGTPNLGAANGPTSEDCLQVNVFAPPAAKAAPVMVWLHGGGFSTGAGWVYDGRNFARDGVVVVTVNYRLGTLGFFAHPALTAAAGAKAPLGNYGVMDQIAALQWVKRNIAAFGGDPDNVTVFGESAGGASVAILLSTPAAKGLFNKAIIQSGLVWQPPGSLPEAEARGTALAGKLGAADLAALRALPPEAIVEAAPDAGPFADGRLLLRTPTEALAQGLEIDVPLIIGWNSGEDSLLGFKLPDPAAVVARYPLARDPAYAADAAMGDERLARILFTESMFG
ncbi:MAG: carboxylesterase family protein, partial [Phenylobacterium sp.]